MFGEQFEKDGRRHRRQVPGAAGRAAARAVGAPKAQGLDRPECEAWAAERLGVSPAHVHGVVTFYTMYRQRPMGKYHIQVCTTLSCMLRGSDELVEHLKQEAGHRRGRGHPRRQVLAGARRVPGLLRHGADVSAQRRLPRRPDVLENVDKFLDELESRTVKKGTIRLYYDSFVG